MVHVPAARFRLPCARSSRESICDQLTVDHNFISVKCFQTCCEKTNAPLY